MSVERLEFDRNGKNELRGFNLRSKSKWLVFGENEVDYNKAPGQTRSGNGGHAHYLEGTNKDNAFGVRTCSAPGTPYTDGDEAIKGRIEDDFGILKQAYFEAAQNGEEPTVGIPVDRDGNCNIGMGNARLGRMQDFMNAQMHDFEDFAQEVDRLRAVGQDLSEMSVDDIDRQRNDDDISVTRGNSTPPIASPTPSPDIDEEEEKKKNTPSPLTTEQLNPSQWLTTKDMLEKDKEKYQYRKEEKEGGVTIHHFVEDKEVDGKTTKVKCAVVEPPENDGRSPYKVSGLSNTPSCQHSFDKNGNIQVQLSGTNNNLAINSNSFTDLQQGFGAFTVNMAEYSGKNLPTLPGNTEPGYRATFDGVVVHFGKDGPSLVSCPEGKDPGNAVTFNMMVDGKEQMTTLTKEGDLVLLDGTSIASKKGKFSTVEQQPEPEMEEEKEPEQEQDTGHNPPEDKVPPKIPGEGLGFGDDPSNSDSKTVQQQQELEDEGIELEDDDITVTKGTPPDGHDVSDDEGIDVEDEGIDVDNVDNKVAFAAIMNGQEGLLKGLESLNEISTTDPDISVGIGNQAKNSERGR